MKKILGLLLICSLSVAVYGQRFGYVDTDYVLNSLPQYTDAQNRVDIQAKNWQQEIEGKQNVLEKMRVAFQNEKILLTKDQITEREKQIEDAEKEITELKEKRYGPTGDMLTTRRNLVKPIQDQIWNAVKKVAERRKYSFIFDKGSDLVMLYSDPKFDVSEEVIRMLLPKGKNKNRIDRNTSQRNNPSSVRDMELRSTKQRIKK